MTTYINAGQLYVVQTCAQEAEEVLRAELGVVTDDYPELEDSEQEQQEETTRKLPQYARY